MINGCRYVRLELLEGVAAYLAGDRNRAQERLQAARAKWQQLQVSDDAVAMLLGMGFSTREVAAPAAVTFLRAWALGQAQTTAVLHGPAHGSY